MTDTYNPIIGKEDLPRLRLFRPQPMPEPGVALVLFQPGRPLVTLWPGQRLTAGEVRWGSYKTVYKVDVTEHTLSFTPTLPCYSDAFDFLADVQVTVSVDEPAKIVERNITDVMNALKPQLLNDMRRISRDYDVEKSAEAEQEIIQTVGAKTYDIGVKIVRFSTELSLENDAREHIRRLRQIKRDMVRQQHEAELEEQKQAQEFARIEASKAFYMPLIENGQWQLLALQLANHPDDVSSVLQYMDQQRQVDMEMQLQALKIMLDEDAIEGFQLADVGKDVLMRLVGGLETKLGKRELLGLKQPEQAPTDTDASSTAEDEGQKEHDSD